MAKRTIFSQPVFSIKVLIPLVAILCSATGTLLSTFPAYADTPLIVIFNNLGVAKSATVLFEGQRLGACLQASSIVTDNPATDRIASNLTGAGMFSVDFYSTTDCSGPREQFHRYQIQGVPGGLIVCNSDTACFSNTLTSAPSNLQDPIPSVLVQGLNNGQGFRIQANGTVQGGCITTNNTQNGTKMLSFPVNGGGTFAATFYSDNSCNSPTNSFTFNSPEGTDGGFVTCTPNQQCSCDGCNLVSSPNTSTPNTPNTPSIQNIQGIQGLQVFFPSDHVPSSGNQGTVYITLDYTSVGDFVGCLASPTNQWNQIPIKQPIQPGMDLTLLVFSDSSCGQLIAAVVLPMPSSPAGDGRCYYNFTPSSGYSLSDCASPTQFITPSFYNSPSNSGTVTIESLQMPIPYS
jgi:hypothetical protein